MRRNAVLLICVILFTAFTVSAKDIQKFGQPITLKDTTAIETILAKPEAFVGKTVLIRGKVVGVCDHMGCWIDVQGRHPETVIRVKVKDGEIVFPKDSPGKTAVVQGYVEKIVLDKEKMDAMKKMHQDKKHGESCESKQMKATKTIYRIHGQGIVMYAK